ncbi:MAG: universal stress protein, partial [Chloroflexota bacterium]|nr:universal stress protein [Chloroflexota bacterium]
MISNVLVPLDGSELAERALSYAEAIGRIAGAKLILVRAVTARTLPGTDPTEARTRVEQEAGSYLAGHAEQLRGT